MGYIVVDLEGASRLSFDRLSEVRDWVYQLSQKDPDLLSELLIERFNDDGKMVGESQWAEEFLARLRESAMAAPDPFAPGATGPILPMAEYPEEAALVVAAAPALRSTPQSSWSGMATSTTYAFSHRHEGAIDTLGRPQGEMAARSPRMSPVAAS